LVDANAFLRLAIEVGVDDVARLSPRSKPGSLQRVVGAQLADLQRPLTAMQRGAEGVVAFAADEVRQHVAPAPAGVAERGPVVVILALATDVDHRVDARRATEHLAARHIAAAAIQARLRHRLEGVVVQLAGHHQYGTRGHRSQPVADVGTGFQHQHLGARVFAQAAGERRAG